MGEFVRSAIGWLLIAIVGGPLLFSVAVVILGGLGAFWWQVGSAVLEVVR